jgi:hypothetical protein
MPHSSLLMILITRVKSLSLPTADTGGQAATLTTFLFLLP